MKTFYRYKLVPGNLSRMSYPVVTFGLIACLCVAFSLLACKLQTPEGLMDAIDPVSFESGANIRNDGELWSGVITGQLPRGAAAVEIAFDPDTSSGMAGWSWKKAEQIGNQWRAFIPVGNEAAQGKDRWQEGSRHILFARARNAQGNLNPQVTKLAFIKRKNKDLNGDGFSDLVVGSQGFNGNQGRVYIFYGKSSGLSISSASQADTMLTGAAALDLFGWSVAMADLNGDGFADLIVGARNTTSGGTAYVFPGSKGGISSQSAATASAVLSGVSGSTFGYFLSSGDFDGNGFDDLCVTALAFDLGAENGRVYIFSGSAAGLATQAATAANAYFTGDLGSDVLGYATATGDTNGDGFADLIMSARGADAGVDDGKVYVFHGGPAGLTTQPLSSANTAITSIAGTTKRFGHALAVGDVNRDGFADIVVAENELSGIGRVYLFHGSTAGVASQSTTTANSTFTGDLGADQFGYSISLADTSNDGFPELLVTAPVHNSNRGRVYVFKNTGAGFTSLAASAAEAVITGVSMNTGLGNSISAGNLNGDAYTEILVGASIHPGGQQGRS